MGTGITKESFSKMKNGSKLDVLFDLTVDTNNRVEKLEKRKRFDTFFSGVTGVVTALGVVLTKLFIFKGE